MRTTVRVVDNVRLGFANFHSKHRRLRWLQIIILLPATWTGGGMSVLLALAAIAATPSSFASLSGREGLASLSNSFLILAVTLSILAGLTSSWIVALRGVEHVKNKPTLRRRVRAGLVLGIVAGVSVLIWVRALPIDPYTTKAQERSLLIYYMFLVDPPLGLAIVRLCMLMRRSDPAYQCAKESSASASAEDA
jgi:hypothetical protein